MIIAIPKERRLFEYRVGLSPAGVDYLCKQGVTVLVEHEAGTGAGFSDYDYQTAGASIVYEPEEVFGRGDLILKIGRPLQQEVEWVQPGKALAGFLHLASTREDRIRAFLEKEITAIAWEQVEEDDSLPLLRPFSEIGGLMSAQIAARLLQNNSGGKGILLGGIAGVPPAEVTILGGGVVGTNAAKGFLGVGAHVTVLDKNTSVLQRLHERFPTLVTMSATDRNIERACVYADVVVGAVLIPGERAPVIVPRETIKAMKPRSVIIDLSIDQGGCFETSRPTTHELPTYIEEGVIHHCVPNIPGVVARTATHAFMNVGLPYIEELAGKGIETAIAENASLAVAVATRHGRIENLSRLLPL